MMPTISSKKTGQASRLTLLRNVNCKKIYDTDQRPVISLSGFAYAEDLGHKQCEEAFAQCIDTI